MRRTITFFMFMTTFFFISTASSYSQEDHARVVKSIRVEGNKAVSAATILSKIKTKEGAEFSQESLNEDLKRLFALGHFADVSIEVEDYEEGVAVIFIVKEKPLVESISFAGNNALSSQKLEASMSTKPGGLMDESKLFADISEIKQLYESRGYVQADVSYRTEIDKKLNTAKLTIIIVEEEKIRIKKIYVQGNESFSDNKILSLISTKPDKLFTSGIFKKDVFREDLEKIKAFYQGSGYLDAEASDELEYSPDGQSLYITIVVEEGNLFLTGGISVKGNKVISSEDLMESLSMVTDKPFSEDGMRMDAINMQQLYFNLGYIMAGVYPASVLNKSSGRIDIRYEVTERDLAYVNKINIRGNSKTKDVVIRRELRVHPGEPFDGSKIRRSRERLNNLGFFEEVSFDTEDTRESSKKDMIVNVKETKTGEFSFGGGYSTVDSFVGFISVTQRNFDLLNFPTFTGDGQYLNVKAEIGSVRNNYVVSWTEPWIFDHPLSFGFDLYRSGHERRQSVGYGYEESRTGGDMKLGKEFTERIKGDLTYKLEEVNISDISEDASADLKDESGANILSTLALGASYDTRDNVFNPTEGNILSIGLEGAGGPLLGDKDFIKYIFGNSTYFNWFDRKVVLELKARAGLADAYGGSGSVPIYERFYAGGANTIRGYKERTASPLDPVTDDPIGGESMLVGNMEVTVPVFKDIIKGAVFYDIGNVWSQIGDFASGGYKHGIGAGARIKTPLGPLKLDLGYPLKKVEGQSQQLRLHFTMSRSF